MCPVESNGSHSSTNSGASSTGLSSFVSAHSGNSNSAPSLSQTTRRPELTQHIAIATTATRAAAVAPRPKLFHLQARYTQPNFSRTSEYAHKRRRPNDEALQQHTETRDTSEANGQIVVTRPRYAIKQAARPLPTLDSKRPHSYLNMTFSGSESDDIGASLVSKTIATAFSASFDFMSRLAEGDTSSGDALLDLKPRASHDKTLDTITEASQNSNKNNDSAAKPFKPSANGSVPFTRQSPVRLQDDGDSSDHPESSLAMSLSSAPKSEADRQSRLTPDTSLSFKPLNLVPPPVEINNTALTAPAVELRYTENDILRHEQPPSQPPAIPSFASQEQITIAVPQDLLKSPLKGHSRLSDSLSFLNLHGRRHHEAEAAAIDDTPANSLPLTTNGATLIRSRRNSKAGSIPSVQRYQLAGYSEDAGCNWWKGDNHEFATTEKQPVPDILIAADDPHTDDAHPEANADANAEATDEAPQGLVPKEDINVPLPSTKRLSFRRHKKPARTRIARISIGTPQHPPPPVSDPRSSLLPLHFFNQSGNSNPRRPNPISVNLESASFAASVEGTLPTQLGFGYNNGRPRRYANTVSTATTSNTSLDGTFQKTVLLPITPLAEEEIRTGKIPKLPQTRDSYTGDDPVLGSYRVLLEHMSAQLSNDLYKTVTPSGSISDGNNGRVWQVPTTPLRFESFGAVVPAVPKIDPKSERLVATTVTGKKHKSRSKKKGHHKQLSQNLTGSPSSSLRNKLFPENAASQSFDTVGANAKLRIKLKNGEVIHHDISTSTSAAAAARMLSSMPLPADNDNAGILPSFSFAGNSESNNLATSDTLLSKLLDDKDLGDAELGEIQNAGAAGLTSDNIQFKPLSSFRYIGGNLSSKLVWILHVHFDAIRRARNAPLDVFKRVNAAFVEYFGAMANVLVERTWAFDYIYVILLEFTTQSSQNGLVAVASMCGLLCNLFDSKHTGSEVRAFEGRCFDELLKLARCDPGPPSMKNGRERARWAPQAEEPPGVSNKRRTSRASSFLSGSRHFGKRHKNGEGFSDVDGPTSIHTEEEDDLAVYAYPARVTLTYLFSRIRITKKMVERVVNIREEDDLFFKTRKIPLRCFVVLWMKLIISQFPEELGSSVPIPTLSTTFGPAKQEDSDDYKAGGIARKFQGEYGSEASGIGAAAFQVHHNTHPVADKFRTAIPSSGLESVPLPKNHLQFDVQEDILALGRGREFVEMCYREAEMIIALEHNTTSRNLYYQVFPELNTKSSRYPFVNTFTLSQLLAILETAPQSLLSDVTHIVLLSLKKGIPESQRASLRMMAWAGGGTSKDGPAAPSHDCHDAPVHCHRHCRDCQKYRDRYKNYYQHQQAELKQQQQQLLSQAGNCGEAEPAKKSKSMSCCCAGAMSPQAPVVEKRSVPASNNSKNETTTLTNNSRNEKQECHTATVSPEPKPEPAQNGGSTRCVRCSIVHDPLLRECPPAGSVADQQQPDPAAVVQTGAQMQERPQSSRNYPYRPLNDTFEIGSRIFPASRSQLNLAPIVELENEESSASPMVSVRVVPPALPPRPSFQNNVAAAEPAAAVGSQPAPGIVAAGSPNHSANHSLSVASGSSVTATPPPCTCPAGKSGHPSSSRHHHRAGSHSLSSASPSVDLRDSATWQAFTTIDYEKLILNTLVLADYQSVYSNADGVVQAPQQYVPGARPITTTPTPTTAAPAQSSPPARKKSVMSVDDGDVIIGPRRAEISAARVAAEVAPAWVPPDVESPVPDLSSGQLGGTAEGNEDEDVLGNWVEGRVSKRMSATGTNEDESNEVFTGLNIPSYAGGLVWDGGGGSVGSLQLVGAVGAQQLRVTNADAGHLNMSSTTISTTNSSILRRGPSFINGTVQSRESERRMQSKLKRPQLQVQTAEIGPTVRQAIRGPVPAPKVNSVSRSARPGSVPKPALKSDEYKPIVREEEAADKRGRGGGRSSREEGARGGDGSMLSTLDSTSSESIGASETFGQWTARSLRLLRRRVRAKYRRWGAVRRQDHARRRQLRQYERTHGFYGGDHGGGVNLQNAKGSWGSWNNSTRWQDVVVTPEGVSMKRMVEGGPRRSEGEGEVVLVPSYGSQDMMARVSMAMGQGGGGGGGGAAGSAGAGLRTSGAVYRGVGFPAQQPQQVGPGSSLNNGNSRRRHSQTGPSSGYFDGGLGMRNASDHNNYTSTGMSSAYGYYLNYNNHNNNSTLNGTAGFNASATTAMPRGAPASTALSGPLARPRQLRRPSFMSRRGRPAPPTTAAVYDTIARRWHVPPPPPPPSSFQAGGPATKRQKSTIVVRNVVARRALADDDE